MPNCLDCDIDFEVDPEFPKSQLCVSCADERKNMPRQEVEGELGAGIIRTLTEDGQRLSLEPWQQVERLLIEGKPTYEYHLESEDPFTDLDLLKLSVRRVRRRFTRKGFTDITYDEVEDVAGDVMVQFLEDMASEKEVRSIHGYHWTLVKAACAKYMQQFVDRRKALIPQDILDIAEANNIRETVFVGEAMSIERHAIVTPMWTRIKIKGIKGWEPKKDLTLTLEDAGLTNRELKVVVNALKGENAGLYSKRKSIRDHTRNAIRKLEGNPEAYAQLKELLRVPNNESR